MDYEKEYNETLERAREIYSDPKKALEKNVNLTNEGSIAAIRVALLDLFPEDELKESEDVRIGNIIYCIIRDNKEVKRILEGNGVSVDNALAYLEKQKQYDIDVLEKHITKDSVSELPQAVIIRNRWEIVEANEQKPAEWSEDDEGELQVAAHRLASHGYPEDAEWLLSIRDRVNLRPKQEWSEEDEKMRKAVLDEIEHQIEIMPDADDMDSDDQDRYNELISMSVWMQDLPKCMKPRWKPSEEQMAMLRAVLNEPKNAMAESANIALGSLYNDLKSL